MVKHRRGTRTELKVESHREGLRVWRLIRRRIRLDREDDGDVKFGWYSYLVGEDVEQMSVSRCPTVASAGANHLWLVPLVLPLVCVSIIRN